MTSYFPDATARSFHVATCDSPLGRVLVATGECGVAAVLLGDDDAELRADLGLRFPHASLLGPNDEARHAAEAVVAAIDTDSADGQTEHGDTVIGDSPGAPPTGRHRSAAPMPPLDLRGTDFQRAVWEALRAIPRGRTATYTEIAARIGRPAAVRAVAQACAANAHAILVPCHRVVRADGALSGYRWGVDRKRMLLRQERAHPR